MSLRISVVDGALSGKSFVFSDSHPTITIGRHPSCDVVFPADDIRVSRYHVALERKLARYRILMQADNPVWIDGEEAHDGDELPMAARIALGHPDGPQLLLETSEDDDLPPTERYARHVSPARMAEEAERISRFARRLTVVLALVVVAMLMGAGWLAHVDSRRQDALIAQVDKAIQPRAEEELASKLRQASTSVYLVAIKDRNGLSPFGTAWVAAPGVLATSAHIADVFGQLAGGLKLIVRAPGTPVRDFTVTGVTLDPLYRRFEQAWRQYGPVAAGAGGESRSITPAGGYDVALLRVSKADAAKLAPPLPIAPNHTLLSLQPGDVVGYVGFPVESAALGGVNPDDPEPQLQIGRLTALTDFFLVKSDPAHRQLLQHTLPVQGGASGSPVLDREGQVVGILSGGNLVQIGRNGVRVATGIGVNFAQRADLLRQLLNGTAGDHIAATERYWERRLRQYHTEMDLALQDWAASHGASALPPPIFETDGRTEPTPSYDMPVYIHPFRMSKPGWYLFLATAADRTDIDMMVVETTPNGPRMVGINVSPDHYPGVEVDADKAAPATIVVPGPGGTNVHLEVYYLPLRAKPVNAAPVTPAGMR